jgi:Transcription factor WhiB
LSDHAIALTVPYHDRLRRLLYCMDAAVMIKRFARCADPRSSYTSLFFSEEPLDIARAKAICSRCIARTQCLAAAIEREEPCGVWGGEIFVDGVPVAEKRRRGRPPRVPRPQLVVDEIPDVA